MPIVMSVDDLLQLPSSPCDKLVICAAVAGPSNAAAFWASSSLGELCESLVRPA